MQVHVRACACACACRLRHAELVQVQARRLPERERPRMHAYTTLACICTCRYKLEDLYKASAHVCMHIPHSHAYAHAGTSSKTSTKRAPRCVRSGGLLNRDRRRSEHSVAHVFVRWCTTWPALTEGSAKIKYWTTSLRSSIHDYSYRYSIQLARTASVAASKLPK